MQIDMTDVLDAFLSEQAIPNGSLEFDSERDDPELRNMLFTQFIQWCVSQDLHKAVASEEDWFIVFERMGFADDPSTASDMVADFLGKIPR